MTNTQAIALVASYLCCASGAAAQTQSGFEVASVKPSGPDWQGTFTRYLPGGGLRIDGAPLKFLISMAYGVRGFQISGGPKWMETDPFDIEAKSVTAPAPSAAPQSRSEEIRSTLERLKSLLADRFQLAIHTETREQPVYALVVAKGGTKLQESTEAGGLVRMMGRGRLKGQTIPLEMLALNLSNELGRRVVNQTGLTGKYSFELTWTPLSTSTPVSGTEPAVSSDPAEVSLFTALQEQLGLRLEPGRGPVEVLVIDRAERPSKN